MTGARHSDGGKCCECGGAHECDVCPVFDGPKSKLPDLSRTERALRAYDRKAPALEKKLARGESAPLTLDDIPCFD